MKLIKNGDQAAFSELYERYHQRLFYFFYRMLWSDKELANDFLQDIFMKLIDKPELFNPKYSFKSWIFSIAHNMCKNEYRKQEIRRQYQTDGNFDCIIDESQSESENTKEELLAQLFAELSNLEEGHHSILLLKYKENLSVKEIAQILELPEGTIKSRLHYARLQLAKKMNNSD